MKKIDKTKICTCIGIIIALLLAFTVSKRINEKTPEVIGYKDITVACGQTLWGISEMYAPDSMDKREYISDVQRINSLGDTLYAGQTITVPIYAEK